MDFAQSHQDRLSFLIANRATLKWLCELCGPTCQDHTGRQTSRDSASVQARGQRAFQLVTMQPAKLKPRDPEQEQLRKMILIKALTSLVVAWLGLKLFQLLGRRRRMTKFVDKLPGAAQYPVIPILELLHHRILNYLTLRRQGDSYATIYQIALGQCKLFEHLGIFRWYMGPKPLVILFSPENIEQIMTSTSVLDKADEYQVFKPWIGEGLLTGPKVKWQSMRKVLTPAFHFRILNDFLPIMNEEATKLVRKLNSVKYTRSFNVTPVISLCALDTICETAMGANTDCQLNENSQYVTSLHDLSKRALARVTQPWLWPDFVFYRTQLGIDFSKSNESMKDFSMGVILKRKAEWEHMLRAAKEAGRAMQDMSFEDIVQTSGFKKSGSKRLAFLDLLMHQHLIKRSMSIEDVRIEVDTFMFAGHDTTAMNTSWTLYMLGLHKDIQERVRKEIDEVFASVGDEGLDETFDISGGQNVGAQLKLSDVTTEHLARMKYLEMVIKESLRMWPSVPFVARQMTEDVVVGGGKYLIPEGSTCMVFTQALHHNTRVYPKPEVFDPDRFSPANTSGRHPFAYIPFSAGPRNCIGQRFAQMEVKVILAKIIRNYHIESTIQRDKLTLVGELVLRPLEELLIRLTPRFKC